MNKQTFEKSSDAKYRKEEIEWLRIWCEDTHKDLPRVALIGDSITEQVFEGVKKELQGVALVDYLATSYSLDSEIYLTVVKKFVEDSDYAVVHYNYGLHAHGVDAETYARRCKEVLSHILTRTKGVVATSTVVFDESLEQENPHWKESVAIRNEKLRLVAQELGLPIDDLNGLSKDLKGDARCPDGVHFSEKGYAVLAESVVKSVKEYL
jgi:predicted nucleic-acid-binding protein